jgi:hypothetical protein
MGVLGIHKHFNRKPEENSLLCDIGVNIRAIKICSKKI